MSRWRTYGPLTACLMALLAGMSGCRAEGPHMKVVFGHVTCGGQDVEEGTVRFVPIRNNVGPASTAYIVGSQYRIQGREGVPVGWHRVEVVVKRKTGRKVPDRAIIGAMTDEWVSISDDRYAGAESPLEVEITADRDGRFDIEVPRKAR